MTKTIQQLELSVLDQQPHFRGYGRYYIIFPFPDLEYANVAVKALRAGLAETLRRFPYLTSTVALQEPGSHRLRALYNEPIDAAVEAAHMLTVSMAGTERSDLKYNTLAKAAFLPENLPSEIFCPSVLKNHPGLDDGDSFGEKGTNFQKGIPVPVFASQATFITGGLVLSIWFYHAIIDGSGNARIQEVWSDYVRSWKQKQRDSMEPDSKLSNSDFNHNRASILQSLADASHADFTIHTPSSARLAPAGLARNATTSSEAFNVQRSLPLLRNKPYNVITKMFRIPYGTVSELGKSLDDITKCPVTNFTALAAVLWAYVIHTRRPLLNSRGITEFTLAVVADLRKHLKPPFSSPNYLGNLVLSAMPSCNISATTSNNISHVNNHRYLATLASKISQSVGAIDKDWITSRLVELNSCNSQISENSHLHFSNGPDLYITSWLHMGLDREWYIPGTSSAKPAAIRRAAWVSEGGIVILPRRAGSDAPFEVMLSLAEDDMRRFTEHMSQGGWLVNGINES